MMHQLLKRLTGAACLASALLAACASLALGSVTIGQSVPGAGGCAANNDWAQLAVASGNSYTVPGSGTITSWSQSAGAGGGQLMTMKIWRQVEGSTFTVVGQDLQRQLTESVVNTFPVSIAVKPGDVLGFHSGAVPPTACLSAVTSGDSVLNRFGDAATGEQASFPAVLVRHLNITAVFEPTNTFTLGSIVRNKKKGNATFTVNVPNPGQLSASTKGTKGEGVFTKPVSAAGRVKLTIRATGKHKRVLNETGKVKVGLQFQFTPTGGDPSTQSRKLKLKKR